MFAIIENISNRHIGNIKIGPINHRYGYADIGYLIGDRESWGKGYACEAIKLITKYGFEDLNLHHMQAGVISGNEASVRVLEKAGYVLEGRLVEKFTVNGQYRDHLLFGCLSSVACQEAGFPASHRCGANGAAIFPKGAAVKGNEFEGK